MGAESFLDVEVGAGYRVLTINRPERRNALGLELIADLADAYADAVADETTNAIVLTGAAPAFCAGSDLKELGLLDITGMQAHQEKAAALARLVRELPVPVIAAVEGYALGGGMILATSCDVVVTGRSAKWHMPEVANGWLPPWGLESLLARTSAISAQAITLGLSDIDGAEALRLGIADHLTEDGEALTRSRELASRLAGLSRPAIGATKTYFSAAINAAAEARDQEASALFAANCGEDQAQKTLLRFRK